VGRRRAATRKPLSQSERKPVDQAADSIENHPQQLRYAQGLPLAPGGIEGACRHRVKERMDSTGARGGLERAEALLTLRSLKGALAASLAFHCEQEHKRHSLGPPIPGGGDEAA
jgi:hypothetical protein